MTTKKRVIIELCYVVVLLFIGWAIIKPCIIPTRKAQLGNLFLRQKQWGKYYYEIEVYKEKIRFFKDENQTQRPFFSNKEIVGYATLDTGDHIFVQVGSADNKLELSYYFIDKDGTNFYPTNAIISKMTPINLLFE